MLITAELRLMYLTGASSLNVLRRVEEYLCSTKNFSVEIPLQGDLSKHFLADQEEFSLGDLATTYIEIGALHDAFRLLASGNATFDPKDIAICMLWFCKKNGMEVDKIIANEGIFDEEACLVDPGPLEEKIATLSDKLAQSEKNLQAALKKIEVFRENLERLVLALRA